MPIAEASSLKRLSIDRDGGHSALSGHFDRPYTDTMSSGYFGGLAVIALASPCVAGCDGRQPSAASRKADVYASREPGSDAAPTNDASFQLLAADGPTRFQAVRDVITQAGKNCSAVTRAVLEGGMDGTDEWRVNCADSGNWQLWFRPDGGRDVDHCSNAKCS